MKKKKKRYGLWDLADMSIALALGVEVELYVEVVEARCDEDEMDKIVLPLLFSENEQEIEESKKLFYMKLTEEEMKSVKLGGSIDLYVGEVDMKNGGK